MDVVRQRYLSRLPDLPLWVETRDLLLWEALCANLIPYNSRLG
jgi:hypothetical protein